MALRNKTATVIASLLLVFFAVSVPRAVNVPDRPEKYVVDLAGDAC